MKTITVEGDRRNVARKLKRFAKIEFPEPKRLRSHLWMAVEHIATAMIPDDETEVVLTFSFDPEGGRLTVQSTPRDTRGAPVSEPTNTTK